MRKSRSLAGRVKRGLGCVSFLTIFLPLPTATVAAEPAFVELVTPKESAPWVGQRTVFAVEVAVEGRFSGSTLFDLPRVVGAILMKPEERPVLSTRTVDDREYSVQRHEFSLFCEQGGEITVPEIHVRCGSIKSFGETPSRHALSVPAFKVTSRIPEGAIPGQVVISTARLEVSEAWNPLPGDAKVGDAFRRTVTLRAADFPGMLLPGFPKPQLEGLAIYFSEPGVQTLTERGEFTGSRVDTLTYLCERPGTVEIPPVIYRWWDPVKSVWKDENLPAVTLDVAPNPNYGSKEPRLAARSRPLIQSSPWWWALALAVVCIVCVFVLRRSLLDEESKTFRQVLRACRDSDAAGAYNAVTRWRYLARAWAATPPTEVSSELVSAQQAIVGLGASWDGRRLEKSLKSWRRWLQRHKIIVFKTGRLPDLNP
jgi:hypothetical protein